MNLDMNKFDKDEQAIHDAFSRINVNPENVASQVKAHIREERPQNVYRVRRTASLAAAVLVVMVLSTTVFALAFGGFDWFMERFDPPFAEVVEPVMIYSEDQGIRMTVIGAQTFDNMAVVYVSLQDVSGENRLTEDTTFWAGFSRAPVDETEEFSVGWMSSGSTLLYFNEVTNSAYFELQLSSDSIIPDRLELSVDSLTTWRVSFVEEPVGISLADLPLAEVITIPGDYVTVSAFEHNYTPYTPETRTLLAPGHFATIPDYPDYHWISNMGIIDGQLRIQSLGTLRGEFFGATSVSLGLVCPQGEMVNPTEVLWGWADENYKPVHLDAIPILEIGEEFTMPPYNLTEYIFDVDLNSLANYMLVFWGSLSEGIEGNWQITAYTEDTGSHLVTLTPDVLVDGLNIEFMTLSPLGLSARGSTDNVNLERVVVEAYLETAYGLIPLGEARGGFTSIFDGDGDDAVLIGFTFGLDWSAESAIDVDAVTAVILEGYRIPIR